MPMVFRRHVSKRNVRYYPNRSALTSRLSRIFTGALSSSSKQAENKLDALRGNFDEEREYQRECLDQLQEKVKSLASDQALQMDQILQIKEMLSKMVTASKE